MALSQAVQDAFNKGGGRQPALPDNTRVRAVIAPTKKDIGYIEKGPFAKDTSNPNSRINALNLRFVIPEGLPNANRNFFSTVPDEFEIFDRSGAKIPSYQSINLMKALGYALEDLDDDTIKKIADREILGKTVDLVLGVEDDNKFDATNPEEAAKAAQNPLYGKRNSVKFINRASAAAPTSSAPRASVPAGGFTPGSYAPPAQAATAPANDPWAAAASAPAGDPWANAAVGATV